jgi:hypothetical protein
LADSAFSVFLGLLIVWTVTRRQCFWLSVER